MKLKVYVIDFETPKWMRKLVAVAALILVVVGVATAVLATPHVFVETETLTADNLNKLSFMGTDGGTYSLGGTKYCGITPPTRGDLSSLVSVSVVGYAAAKKHCQTACGNSPSAHVCSGQELLANAQLGWTPPSTGLFWYATATWSYFSDPSGGHVHDCRGFEGASSTDWGPVWTANYPSADHCNQMHPILCCD